MPGTRLPLHAPQVTIFIHDALTPVVVVERCISPSTVHFLALGFESISIRVYVLAGLPVSIAWCTWPAAIAVSMTVTATMRAGEIPVQILNLSAAALEVVELRGVPVVVRVLAARIQSRSTNCDITAGFSIGTAGSLRSTGQPGSTHHQGQYSDA